MLYPTRTTARGIRFIAGWEGCVLHPYNDAAGSATIGYGHLLHTGNVTPADRARYSTFTAQEASVMLAADLLGAEQAVLQKVRPPFRCPWRFDAIVSVVFNLGPGVLEPSHDLGRLLSTRLRRGAADSLLEYDHAGGVVVPGLLRRRQAERRLFLFALYG